MLSVVATAPAAETQPADRAGSVDRTPCFREACFGMFIHWGVCAVPAGEWQGKPVNGSGEWIMKNGKIPVADYRAFAKDFTASRYDPPAWAALARRAGEPVSLRHVWLTPVR